MSKYPSKLRHVSPVQGEMIFEYRLSGDGEAWYWCGDHSVRIDLALEIFEPVEEPEFTRADMINFSRYSRSQAGPIEDHLDLWLQMPDAEEAEHPFYKSRETGRVYSSRDGITWRSEGDPGNYSIYSMEKWFEGGTFLKWHEGMKAWVYKERAGDE